MSNSYDIKCKVIEEELRSVWPDWHVVGRLGGSAHGDVFQIYRDNYGIRVDSALKVIQVDSGAAAAMPSSKGKDNGKTEAGEAKTEKTEAAGQSDIPEALLGEIQIMEALRGVPNIVAIEDIYFKRDASICSLFVRMELLTSIQEVLTDRGGHGTLSSIREIIKLGRDICTALMQCEMKGIIHRDIKPTNLFVDDFGHYKVGDFGVSKRMDTVHIAQTMTGIGTISYMAPEIFQGRSYNNTADIYSLGLILYQLLNNGRMPFLPTEGFYSIQDIDSANYRRLHGTPVPSLTGKTVRGAMVDRRLDAVVRKACAMDAADRYQTAKEFNDALALAETEEKKPLSVYRKRPQGSLAPAVYLQNRQQGSLASAVYLQNRPQERTRSENGIKLSGDMEPALDLNGMPQGRKKSESEKKTLTAPLPYRSYQSRSQRKGRRPGRHNKPVIIIVLLLFIAVAALAALHNRRRTISDSWEEIIAAGEDGTYIDKYKIGDTKELDLGEAGVIEMELVAFDADELADGSGKAPMTWIAKDLLDTEHAMNDNNSNEGGWPASDMRTWLRESILPMFPETVCSNIKEVKKYSYSSSDNETISSSDTIWIPSGREIFGEDDTREDEGPEYVKAFPHSAARRKYHIRASEPSWWWLRSASITIFDNSDCFDRVTGTGLEMSSTSASIEDGVAIGFCF